MGPRRTRLWLAPRDTLYLGVRKFGGLDKSRPQGKNEGGREGAAAAAAGGGGGENHWLLCESRGWEL